MLSKRLATKVARPLLTSTTLRTIPRTSPLAIQQRNISQADIDDPNMNGGYINPPAQKRQHRDPYGDWWDKQERRNYGEPIHEDNDILGIFSTYDYTHFSAAKSWALFGSSIAVFLGGIGLVYMTYPDKPSARRTFPGGLEAELGGPGVVRAPIEGEEAWPTKT